MVKLVAVEGPMPGAVCIVRNRYRSPRRHKHGITHGAGNPLSVDRHDLKVMAMQMDRVTEFAAGWAARS
jgi:hypothetical protein